MEALEERRLLANIIPSGVISSTPDGSNFDYTITLSNSSESNASIGTFWYAWIPGQDYLATSPITVSPPTGWTDNITSMGAGDGYAIQYISNSSADNVQPGSSLNFSFTSADSPTSVNGDSVFYPGTPVGTSFVYPQGPFSDAGHDFVVTQAPTLKSIAVTPADTSLPAGETEQFTATGTLSDNTTEDLTSQATWASSDTTWATISSTGLATSVSPGPVTISATFDGITGSTGLTATAAVLESIALTPADPSVSKGQTEQFTATGTLSDNTTENLTSQVTWASATTSVATITAGGLATAVATGTSSISAKFDGISGTTVLTVGGPAALSPVAVKANSQGGYYQYGPWVTVSGGYNGTYEVANPQVSSTASNRWNLTVPAGNYDLYATWVASTNNATNAGYTVYDGFTKLGSFQANQQLTPGDGAFGGVLWAKLGAITITQGKLTIAMSASGANGDIVANAILLTPVSVAATAMAAAATVSGSLSPSTSIPMGPIAMASTSGPVQNGGGAGGTVSSSTPAVASLPGGAVSPATSTSVNDAAGTTTGDAETAPSTSQSLSVTDHAIAEVAKGRPRKQRKSLIERLARARVSESHLSAGHHHPKA